MGKSQDTGKGVGVRGGAAGYPVTFSDDLTAPRRGSVCRVLNRSSCSDFASGLRASPTRPGPADSVNDSGSLPAPDPAYGHCRQCLRLLVAMSRLCSPCSGVKIKGIPLLFCHFSIFFLLFFIFVFSMPRPHLCPVCAYFVEHFVANYVGAAKANAAYACGMWHGASRGQGAMSQVLSRLVTVSSA